MAVGLAGMMLIELSMETGSRSEEMEREGSSISAIPSTGALDNESLLFIWEGDAGFPLPTQFRNKRSDCGSGSVRLIARPQLRREVVPSQHTPGWPPEKPLPSFLGVCTAGRCSALSPGKVYQVQVCPYHTRDPWTHICCATVGSPQGNSQGRASGNRDTFHPILVLPRSRSLVMLQPESRELDSDSGQQ